MVMQLIDNEWFNVTESFNPETGEKHTVKNKHGIVDVPVSVLLDTWEDLVIGLSDKEKELYELKESIFNKEQEIIRTTDFQKLYKKNNKDVRKEHLDKVLADDYTKKKDLEFRIDFIKQYVPLLKEVIRAKQSMGEF